MYANSAVLHERLISPENYIVDTIDARDNVTSMKTNTHHDLDTRD